jgi:hypothetical protein
MDEPAGRLSLLGRSLPPAFELRLVAVAPDHPRAYAEADWRDALVIVEDGEIELECLDGGRHSFQRGDVIWLIGLRLRALHSRGLRPAVLAAVSRRSHAEAS